MNAFTAGCLVTLVVLVSFLGGCRPAPEEIPPEQLPGSPFHYPENLWDARVEGETVLEIHVSAEGTVDSARVAQTSGYEEFDSAAVEGALDLRFQPGRRGDEAIPVRVLLPVQFQLPNSEAPAPTPEATEP